MSFYKDWIVIIAGLLIFFSSVGSIVIWSIRNGISPMPSSRKSKACLIKALPQEIIGKIYELGSGWGTLLVPLACRYPSCEIWGYETSPLPFLFTQFRLFLHRLPNVSVYRQDFFQVSLSEASLVVCYLYPGAMRQLKNKLIDELKPGARVITNTFSIPGWQPTEIFEVDDLYRTKIYLYVIRSSARFQIGGEDEHSS